MTWYSEGWAELLMGRTQVTRTLKDRFSENPRGGNEVVGNSSIDLELGGWNLRTGNLMAGTQGPGTRWVELKHWEFGGWNSEGWAEL